MEIFKKVYVIALISLILSSCEVSEPKAKTTKHPDSLTYKQLEWQVPSSKPYRKSLKNGTPFYYAEDKKLPLFSLDIVFKAGSLYKENGAIPTLHSMSLGNGGAKGFNSARLDSIFDLYAIKFNVSSGKSKTVISISGLSEYFPKAMEIFGSIIQTPAFEDSRVTYNKEALLSSIEHRFNTAGPVLQAGWKKVIYPNSSLSKLLTIDDVNSVTKKEIWNYHNYLMRNSDMLVSFVGDIQEDSVTSIMNTLFGKDRGSFSHKKEEIKVSSKPKVLIVHKEINQAYVRLGLPTFKRPDKRFYPFQIFNEILGGGGFTSKLVQEVRSNAGLTYSIYSQISSDYDYTGTFTTTFFTKTETINQALGMSLDIIKESISKPLTQKELDRVRKQYKDGFPTFFRDKGDIVSSYLDNEFDGRSPNHFIDYMGKLDSIKIEDITKSVNELLKPENFSIVIVGDTSSLFTAPKYKEFAIKSLTYEIINEGDL